jgi:hypothetical protein
MNVIPLMLDRVPAPCHAQGAQAAAVFEILRRDIAEELQRLIVDYLCCAAPMPQEKKERHVQRTFART